MGRVGNASEARMVRAPPGTERQARSARVLRRLAFVLGCGKSEATKGDGGPIDVGPTLDGGSVDAGPTLGVLAGIPEHQGTVDGIGGNSLFRVPASMATDGSGNLYVTDNGTVRQIVIATGAVSTLAGHPASMDADGTARPRRSTALLESRTTDKGAFSWAAGKRSKGRDCDRRSDDAGGDIRRRREG